MTTAAASRNFEISLAAWSMHKQFFAKQIDQMGMLDLTHELGIGALELVNTFFPSPQYAYLKQFRKHADELGVTIPLLMCDARAAWRRPTRRATAGSEEPPQVGRHCGRARLSEHSLQHRRARRRR
jgi:hypothetical protein